MPCRGVYMTMIKTKKKNSESIETAFEIYKLKEIGVTTERISKDYFLSARHVRRILRKFRTPGTLENKILKLADWAERGVRFDGLLGGRPSLEPPPWPLPLPKPRYRYGLPSLSDFVSSSSGHQGSA